MASIRKYTLSDGTIKYQCEIVIKKDGIVVHRESKTFLKIKLAKDWGMRREVELQHTSVYAKKDYLPIREIIELYIKEFRPEGRTKNADLLALMKRDIASIDIHKLEIKDLIKHVRLRNLECKPQTATNDLIWLGVVVRTIAGVIDLEVDMSIFDTAREILKAEGLIAHSEQRERRPTKKELWELSRYFDGKNTPMLHLMWFAIFSARRQSEICKIEWADIKHDDRTCMLRDMKDPRKKGVKKRFKIPLSAYKIIMRQPKQDARIFPYNPKTIGKYFTDACKVLGIYGLHFHDLRHEGTSRLFEKGLSIQHVQQITLHSTWTTLQRYCNLDPGDIDI
jgi:integrase